LLLCSFSQPGVAEQFEADSPMPAEAPGLDYSSSDVRIAGHSFRIPRYDTFSMSELTSLFRVELSEHRLCPGRTKHSLSDASGTREFPPFTALEICSTANESSFYLMYESETGLGTDTWHQTLDDAMHQAEWEFGVVKSEWQKTDRPYR
jgi:hypothetical protein